MVGTDAAAPVAAVGASLSLHATARNTKYAEGGILASADACTVALALGKDLAAVDFNCSRDDAVFFKFLAGADACSILAAVSRHIAALDDDFVDAAVLSAADASAVAVMIATGVAVAVGKDVAAL